MFNEYVNLKVEFKERVSHMCYYSEPELIAKRFVNLIIKYSIIDDNELDYNVYVDWDGIQELSIIKNGKLDLDKTIKKYLDTTFISLFQNRNYKGKPKRTVELIKKGIKESFEVE